MVLLRKTLRVISLTYLSGNCVTLLNIEKKTLGPSVIEFLALTSKKFGKTKIHLNAKFSEKN